MSSNSIRWDLNQEQAQAGKMKTLSVLGSLVGLVFVYVFVKIYGMHDPELLAYFWKVSAIGLLLIGMGIYFTLTKDYHRSYTVDESGIHAELAKKSFFLPWDEVDALVKLETSNLDNRVPINSAKTSMQATNLAMGLVSATQNEYDGTILYYILKKPTTFFEKIRNHYYAFYIPLDKEQQVVDIFKSKSPLKSLNPSTSADKVLFR